MTALVLHTDSPTVAMAAVIVLAGVLLGVGLIWTIRYRSASTDLPANALRHAGSSRPSGSAQDRVDALGLGDDFESETP